MNTDWRDRLIVKSTPPPRRSKYMRELHRALEAGGWSVTSRGMPDFAAFKKGLDGKMHFMLVEAVRRRTYKLRRHQQAVIEALMRCGVPCYRYNCDVGEFEELNFKPPSGVTPPGWREQWRREEIEEDERKRRS